MLRQRRQHPSDLPIPPSSASPPPAASSSTPFRSEMYQEPASEAHPLLRLDDADDDADVSDAPDAPLAAPAVNTIGDTSATASTTWLARNQWIALALASGACAAFNGVFAKLTTTELTSRLSQAFASFLGLDAAEAAVEVAVRGTFFALNLIFNGIMWTLFTRALARGYSATQVSIMNTSANFVLTALLGFVIFSESLPPLWWVGAAMLVAGNVIIGRKDEGAEETAIPDNGEATVPGSSPVPADGAAAATAATTVSAIAAIESNLPTTTPAPERRRASRRLAARGPGTVSSASTPVPNTPTYLSSREEKSDSDDIEE